MRKKTREVRIQNIAVGADHAIAVQSMTKTDTADVKSTVAQIAQLTEGGCDIIRCAVPNIKAAEAIGEIKKAIRLPLVADIHFDYRLAIAALEYGADKVRINPGNIGGFEKAAEVLSKAKTKGCAVRIGVNSGSLSKDLLTKYGTATAEALVEDALRYVTFAEEKKFYDLVISIKSSDVQTTYAANKLFSSQCDYPLHIGVTEAGTYEDGIIKSAAGIGALLLDGVGDTLRVSLSDDPIYEVQAGRRILRLLGIEKAGVEVISCPTCGRCKADVINYAKEVREKTKHMKVHVKLAVMGCAVNGPGEAKEADLGLAFGSDNALLFARGKMIQYVKTEDAVETLLQHLNAWIDKNEQ